MTRGQKLIACVVLAVVSVLAAIAIGAEMAKPVASQGVNAVAPVTAAGWIQLGLSLLSAAGFSATGIWQAALAWMETKGAAAVKKIMPAASDTTVQDVINLAEITTMLGMVKGSSGEAQQQFIKGARLKFDALRDSLFPLSAGQ